MILQVTCSGLLVGDPQVAVAGLAGPTPFLRLFALPVLASPCEWSLHALRSEWLQDVLRRLPCGHVGGGEVVGCCWRVLCWWAEKQHQHVTVLHSTLVFMSGFERVC